jgi:hypothetical protein
MDSRGKDFFQKAAMAAILKVGFGRGLAIVEAGRGHQRIPKRNLGKRLI